MQVKTFLIFFSICTFVACQNKKSTDENSGVVSTHVELPSVEDTTAEKKEILVETETSKDSTAQFSVTITEGDKGFGYEIYQNNNLIIRQPHIPAVQGMREFATRDEAQKVANLVIGKLQKGISPPSVSLDELTSLGIKH